MLIVDRWVRRDEDISFCTDKHPAHDAAYNQSDSLLYMKLVRDCLKCSWTIGAVFSTKPAHNTRYYDLCPL